MSKIDIGIQFNRLSCFYLYRDVQGVWSTSPLMQPLRHQRRFQPILQITDRCSVQVHKVFCSVNGQLHHHARWCDSVCHPVQGSEAMPSESLWSRCAAESHCAVRLHRRHPLKREVHPCTFFTPKEAHCGPLRQPCMQLELGGTLCNYGVVWCDTTLKGAYRHRSA